MPSPANIAAALCLFAAVECASVTAADRPPNLLLIMTDNHGAWTLGCYGNPDIQTPHIDRLAAEGMLFTRAFASNAVCSPTRATYLTGLVPSQHGVHCFLRANEAQTGPGAYCTIAEFRTLPKVLAGNGWHCGLVGKWHLGGNESPQEGFQDWVTMPHGATATFYDAEVIEDRNTRREPQYLTDFWTDRAVRFLHEQGEKNRDRPFFLFLSYNGPYALGRLLLRPARNRHADYYAEKWLPSFPRAGMHPWLFNNREYLNNPVSIRRVAAEVSGVDDGVGAVLEALRELNLDRDTLVVFCADQGWLGGQNGLWGMGDHTRPLSAFDGMMQVPLIVRHPGRIPAGTKSDLLVSNYDLMPTLLAYLGLPDATHLNPRSPGRDFSPTLLGRDQPDWDQRVFYEMEHLRAIRTTAAKYVHRHPDGPHELYDLATDPGEKMNLYGQPRQAALQRELERSSASSSTATPIPAMISTAAAARRRGCCRIRSGSRSGPNEAELARSAARLHQRNDGGTRMIRRLPGSDPGPMTVEIIDDPEYNQSLLAGDEQFEQNVAWLEARWPDVLSRGRGKFVVVANQQAFVASTADEAWSWARENHADDCAPVVQYVSQHTLARIYAAVQRSA